MLSTPQLPSFCLSGFRDGLFVNEHDWPLTQTLEPYFYHVEQLLGFPLRDLKGSPLPDPGPVPLGKNMYNKHIKAGRFPATFEGQKTMAMIAFDPRWMDEERVSWVDGCALVKEPTWKDLASESARSDPLHPSLPWGRH